MAHAPDTISINVDVKPAVTKIQHTLRSIVKEELTVFNSLRNDRPQVYTALVRCAELLASKGHDYTSEESNDYENFEEQMRIREQSARQVFRGIIAQKLTREKAVAQKGTAKHESRIDTIIDIANYGILWLGYELDHE